MVKRFLLILATVNVFLDCELAIRQTHSYTEQFALYIGFTLLFFICYKERSVFAGVSPSPKKPNAMKEVNQLYLVVIIFPHMQLFAFEIPYLKPFPNCF